MLTLAQYKLQFPDAKNWGSWADHLQPGVRLIKEGMLLFTPDSAGCWAGPFEGNYAQFNLRDFTHCEVTYGPNKGKSWLEQLAKAEIERKAAAERDIFGKKIFSKYPEDPSLEFPIKLWMAGNDDTSYSKCYRTEQDALEELELFSVNEPLDFHQVVQDFGFIFTN